MSRYAFQFVQGLLLAIASLAGADDLRAQDRPTRLDEFPVTLSPAAVQPVPPSGTVLGASELQFSAVNPPPPIVPEEWLGGPADWSIEGADPYEDAYQWQLLPDGLIYHSYLAGVKEPRFGMQIFRDEVTKWMLDATLGGRVGILRYGTGSVRQPAGYQLDMEGAAFPRLSLTDEWDLYSSDFRFGLPLTYGEGNWAMKFGYYHLSSHVGDELIIADPTWLTRRINYSRDNLVLGFTWYANDRQPVWFFPGMLRLYAEAAWAFYYRGGARPWEFQFGAELSDLRPTGARGAPFFAVNAHLREELDFSGSLTAQTGWQWRGESGDLFRIGLHYYNGNSSQFEFLGRIEEQLGLGVWYDY